jgi:ComF family protein
MSEGFRPASRLHRILEGISGVCRSTLDLMFPRTCLGCQKQWLQNTEELWCVECMNSISWIGSPMCPVCGRPFPKSPSASDHLCGECLASTFHFDHARSAVVHAGIVRDGIHSLKFGGHLHYVPSLVQVLMESMGSEVETFDGMILPVPLHTRRLRQRGFNQAALLARELGKRAKLNVRFDVLLRRHWTEPQTRLSREERLKNVKGAFRVVFPALIQDQTILLLDDVYTTGTTISECARVLKQAGAGTVQALTVTRSVPELNLLRKLEEESTRNGMPDHG